MGILQRAAILLAIAAPLFVATDFHPALWQVLVVAVIGSAAGQLVWRLTRARSRGVQLGVLALGLVVAAGGALAFRSAQHPSAAHTGFIVVASAVANGSPPSLTLGDLDALAPRVGAIAPLAHKAAQLIAGDTNWQANVHGTTPAYFQLRGWRAARGALFTQEDLDASAKVVVLGATTADQLFGAADPVGQTIRIQNLPFTVAGVLAPTQRVEDDDVAIIPMTTYVAKIHRGMSKTFDGVFLISAATPESVRAILRDRHRLAPTAEDDFIIRDLR